MNTWWSKLSLQNKLQIPIRLILLAIMVMAQRTVLSKFEEHMIEGGRQKAVVSADGELNELPQGDMGRQVDGHAHQVAGAAHSLGQDVMRLAQSAQQQSAAILASSTEAVGQVGPGIAQVAKGSEKVAGLSNESLERAKRSLENISVSINQQRDASLDNTRNAEQIAIMDSQSNAVVKRTVSAVKSMEVMAGQLNRTIGRFLV